MSEGGDRGTPNTVTADVAVAGGGLAGFSAVRELRGHGFTGSIVLIDPEGRPYDRPPLSKQYLADPAAELELADDDEFAALDVELLTAPVVALDPSRRTLDLADGRRVQAEHVVLAVGGRARSLPGIDPDTPGVLTLRHRADADALRGRLTPGHRLLIVGAGLIGAEVASSALGLGARVTLVDPSPLPLGPAVGEHIATALHRMHAEHGVEVLQARPRSVTGGPDGLSVDVGDRTLGADTVLLAVGLEIDRTLADTAGLEFDNGIVVDDLARTNLAGLYAVGDCARLRLGDGTLAPRAEHWEHALRSGATVAATIAGEPQPEHGAGWFWSDRYGVHVEAVGVLPAHAPVVARPGPRGTAVFALDPDSGHVIGAAAIDEPHAIRAARRLIDRAVPVTADELADPELDLRALLRR